MCFGQWHEVATIRHQAQQRIAQSASFRRKKKKFLQFCGTHLLGPIRLLLNFRALRFYTQQNANRKPDPILAIINAISQSFVRAFCGCFFLLLLLDGFSQTYNRTMMLTNGPDQVLSLCFLLLLFIWAAFILPPPPSLLPPHARWCCKRGQKEKKRKKFHVGWPFTSPWSRRCM